MLELSDGLTLLLSASVLSLRGNNSSPVTKQPLVHPNGNVLLWNGEIFESDLIEIAPGDNDGAKLLEKLNEFHETNDIFKVFETIKGPFAFVYLERTTNRLYFGRDRLGRRSLLINSKRDSNRDEFPALVLSSVQVEFKMEGFENEFDELSANFLYKIDLKESFDKIDGFQWSKSGHLDEDKKLSDLRYVRSDFSIIDSISPLNINTDAVYNMEKFNSVSIEFFEKLTQSVRRRVENLPTHCKACSKGDNLKKFDGSEQCGHAKLAVLFSGGVDSAVLAALADLCLPKDQPIDLLNIAFEKPKTQKINPNQKSKIKFEKKLNIPTIDEFLVPDRISGLECLKELNPKRKWNFVEINVTLEELKKEREEKIKHLLYPHQTVLDDSIGCALWFASRGKGKILDSNGDKIEYVSNAEVLLLGMGADEQLAGYSRHRTRYEREGLQGLCNELEMEMGRISERNLGRDDRILSDHGKESRLPFLDEDVISFLNSVEVVFKCNLSLPRGQGEKFLLRHLASTRLGLNFSSSLQKRAIQFGSRVAKIENSKEKASDLCGRIARLDLDSNNFTQE